MATSIGNRNSPGQPYLHPPYLVPVIGEIDIRTVFEIDDSATERFFDTFYAFHAGHCLRQLYLSKTEFVNSRRDKGQLDARQLVQQHLGEQLKRNCPHINQSPRCSTPVDSLSFVGRPTCVNSETETVYHIKPRNGWYRFHPPNERHLDQMEVYFQVSNANRGRLVYVSMADYTDYRLWPSDGYLTPDPDRFNDILSRVRCVRDEIVANGVATEPAEIPFDPCDCYLCESEALAFDGEQATSSTSFAIPSERNSTTDIPEAPNSGQPSPATNWEAEIRETDGRHVPAKVRELDIWVVWDCREKIALAPWQSGTMYPCRWAADSGLDPRRSFEKAKMVSELPLDDMHRTWPFPDETDFPESVEPAVLLPHEPPDPPLAFVDLDGVRDPETGEVSGEALSIVDELGGFTEVSRSRTGLHTFTRGVLPPDRGMVSAPLETSGRIEIYDHSRFVGGTWHHLEGTPTDVVPDAQTVIEALAGGILVHYLSRRVDTVVGGIFGTLGYHDWGIVH